LRVRCDYVFLFICVMPIPGKTFQVLHFGNKQNSQAVNTPKKKYSALT